MQQDADLFPDKLRKALPPKPYLGVRVADAYIDNVRRFMGMLRCCTAGFWLASGRTWLCTTGSQCLSGNRASDAEVASAQGLTQQS